MNDGLAPLDSTLVGPVGSDPELPSTGGPAAGGSPEPTDAGMPDVRDTADQKGGLMLAVRFWEKVDHYRADPDGCWLWTGSRNRKGYGQISVGGRRGRPQLAHRIAWTLVNGPIPDGVKVLHSCDNPPCVNSSAHLFLGTLGDNNADMVAKGRDRKAIGEAAPTAVLTEATVLEMRRLHREEGLGCRRLGAMFSVADGTAQAVISRRTWRHL